MGSEPEWVIRKIAEDSCSAPDLSGPRYPLNGHQRRPNEDADTLVLPVIVTFSGARHGATKAIAGGDEAAPVEYEFAAFFKYLWCEVLDDTARRRFRKQWGIKGNARGAPYAKAFGRILDVVESVGYDLDGVAVRRKAAPGYAVLIRAIAALGSPLPGGDGEERPQPGTPERFKDDRKRAVEALAAFCNVFPADCWTAYYRNRRLNRVYRLASEADTESGLRYPETMAGFVWRHDLPTRLLFSDQSTNLFPPFPETNGPLTPGCFQAREDIDPRRVVGIRLAWDQTRLVLFMNWRKCSPEHARKRMLERPALRAVWGDLDRNCTGAEGAAESPMQSLQLAVRYLTGWLNVAGIDLSEAVESRGPSRRTTPGDIFCKVAKAALEGTQEDQAQEVRSAVEKLLEVEAHVNLHWTNGAAVGEDPPRSLIVFRTGKYQDSEEASSPAFPIEADKEGLVHQSVCALAALWDIPLLIRDFQRRISDTRTWSDLHYRRSGPTCTSEIAIPLCDDQGPLCVLNVECVGGHKGDLRPADLRQSELVMHYFGAMHAAVRSPHAGTRELIEHLFTMPSPPNAQALLRKFLKRISSAEALNADLAYALIYDPRVRVFRPMGVYVSRASLNQFFSSPVERSNLDRHANAAALELTLEKSKEKSWEKQVHALAEHAIATRLLPRRRGKTWSVFTSGRPILVGPVDDDARQRCWWTSDGRPQDDESRDPAAQAYAPYRFAFPLASQESGKADGVICLAWREPPAHLGFEHLGPGDYPKFAEEIKKRTGAAAAAVAAAYALFRYFDPDSATDSLPYEQPKLVR